jgi:hypothetical protein
MTMGLSGEDPVSAADTHETERRFAAAKAEATAPDRRNRLRRSMPAFSLVFPSSDEEEPCSRDDGVVVLLIAVTEW